MTDIEKAIEFQKGRTDGLKYYYATYADIYGDAEMSDEQSKSFYKGGNEQIKREEIILQSLQEKAEREKGCEYCNAYKNIATIDYGETQIIVDLNGDNIRIFDNETPGICENNKIKYCPMCGRRWFKYEND